MISFTAVSRAKLYAETKSSHQNNDPVKGLASASGLPETGLPVLRSPISPRRSLRLHLGQKSPWKHLGKSARLGLDFLRRQLQHICSGPSKLATACLEVLMRFLFAVLFASSLIASPASAQQGGGGAPNPPVTGV